MCAVPAGRGGCRQGAPAAGPGTEGNGPGIGRWKQRDCHGHAPAPCPKSTEQGPPRGEVSVASFSKGTQRGQSACFHFKVLSSMDTCLHSSAPSHPLEMPEGPWHYPYGTAHWSQNCHHLTPLPYANGRRSSLFLHLDTQRNAFWTPGPPLREGRSREETCSPSPHPPVQREGQLM